LLGACATRCKHQHKCCLPAMGRCHVAFHFFTLIDLPRRAPPSGAFGLPAAREAPFSSCRRRQSQVKYHRLPAASRFAGVQKTARPIQVCALEQIFPMDGRIMGVPRCPGNAWVGVASRWLSFASTVGAYSSIEWLH
jgi:hypothetical protein